VRGAYGGDEAPPFRDPDVTPIYVTKHYHPYGGERVYTDTCPQNYKFTGQERDTETGNDYFKARTV